MENCAYLRKNPGYAPGVVLSCNVLLIYCYVDIIQYNAMHKFVGVLDNPHFLRPTAKAE